MSSTLFNSTSFQYALTFIERLLQKEDNVFNVIDLCHDDPTLSLNLHIILEAIKTEKLLDDSLGCGNDATLNLHTIVTTSIATAICHGILDVIRDSEKSFVPDFICTHFAGQGIINYFKKFNTHIHSYRTGGKYPTYQPYPKWACPPLILQLLPPTIDARSARRMGTSTETALTTFARDVTAGAQDTPCLTAPQRKR